MENLLINPWFMGIGVTVVGGLILRYGFGIGKNQESKNTDHHTQMISGNGNNMAGRDLIINPKAPAGKRINKITPKEIKKSLDDLPPYQRKAVAGNFKGLRVRWEVNLISVHDLVNGNIRIGSSFEDAFFPWVYFEIDPSEYPEFKLMKKGVKFIIEGVIEDVDRDIELKNCIVSEL